MKLEEYCGSKNEWKEVIITNALEYLMAICKCIFGFFLALISVSQSVGMENKPLPALPLQQEVSVSLNNSWSWVPADQLSGYYQIIQKPEFQKRKIILSILRFAEREEGYLECPWCPKKFPLQLHIAMHQLLNHEVDTDSIQPPKNLQNTITCLICGLHLPAQKHELHFNDKHEPLENGAFKCFCGKNFSTHNALERHKNLHNHQALAPQSSIEFILPPSPQLKAAAIQHAAMPKQSLITKKEIPDFLAKRKEVDAADENLNGVKRREIQYGWWMDGGGGLK